MLTMRCATTILFVSTALAASAAQAADILELMLRAAAAGTPVTAEFTGPVADGLVSRFKPRGGIFATVTVKHPVEAGDFCRRVYVVVDIKGAGDQGWADVNYRLPLDEAWCPRVIPKGDAPWFLPAGGL